MGCDIHSYCETKDIESGKWKRVCAFFKADEWSIKRHNIYHKDHPFENRNYSLFGFLADVRNMSECPVICERRGFPCDASESVEKEYAPDGSRDLDWHSSSYLTLKELLEFNYEQKFENKRVNDPDRYEMITVREHLNEWYFDILEQMKKLGEPENVRIVFWFDS